MKPTYLLNSQPASRQDQGGVVLVVALIILLVISMIAISSMRGSALDEKMAGNSSDRNIAFQSAESGIREAETFVEGIVSLGNFSGTGGLYSRTEPDPDYLGPTFWTDASNSIVADTTYGAYAAPKYYVKHFTTVVGREAAMNMSGYGDNKGTGDVTIFKITARGTGGSADSAEVVLRTDYGRKF